MKPQTLHGLLVIDKPAGLTSRGVVDALRRDLPRGTRIGHTGTLDPLATGVLVLCLGAATRLAEYVQEMPKTYRAGIRLGARSDTDDADGTVTPVEVERVPDLALVREVVASFCGEITQAPPAFSALKLQGRRACDLARQGQSISLAARPVSVYRIDVVSYEYPHLDIEVHCGKGTYIRSLARDLGEALGCGGLIETLRRMSVGPFTADRAVAFVCDPLTLKRSLHSPLAALACLPHLVLQKEQAEDLYHGRYFVLPKEAVVPSAAEPSVFAAFSSAGLFLGLVRAHAGERVVHPFRVFREEFWLSPGDHFSTAEGCAPP
jgi:tRNA pseudouridine55 synthase